MRRQIGKSFGDMVEVVLNERDNGKSPLWKCPRCGREFQKKGQSHYCGEKPKTKHIGLYPGPAAVEEFAEALKGYQTDKGTIRIPYGKVDAELIKRIALWCYETGNHA